MAAVQGRCCAPASPQALHLGKARPAALAPAAPGLPQRRQLYNGSRVVCAAGPGGNVIDRPTTLPGLGKRKESRHQKPPRYSVLLHNDSYNKREYVVRVLLKVVDGMTVDDAVNVMQEAHINGLALVTMCAQDEAERYVEGLRLNGLIATLEPAGPGKA